jgi:glycosyltransferase involved in cell wall biosynthesis
VIPAQPIVSSVATTSKKETSCQIIGLLKNRTSGITLSRHAYADVLRSIHPDLADVGTKELSVVSGINVWAARPLSRVVLDELGRFRRPGKNVWCFVCESTVLPEGSLEACANADQVWVPSRFVERVCLEGGMDPEKVKLVPYYMHSPTREHSVGSVGRPWTVLVSWDGISSLHRKNVLASIRCFQEAWPAGHGDAVRLRLKTRDLRGEYREMVLGAMGGDHRIELVEETFADIEDVFEGVDTLLHIHRAEGYGRHVMEAMLRRIPVVVTDYSGPQDWCHRDETWLVPSVGMVETKVQTEYQYPQGGVWAEPDLDSAVVRLLQVRRQAEGYRLLLDKKLAGAQKRAAAWSSMENSRAAMVSALERI